MGLDSQSLSHVTSNGRIHRETFRPSVTSLTPFWPRGDRRRIPFGFGLLHFHVSYGRQHICLGSAYSRFERFGLHIGGVGEEHCGKNLNRRQGCSMDARFQWSWGGSKLFVCHALTSTPRETFTDRGLINPRLKCFAAASLRNANDIRTRQHKPYGVSQDSRRSNSTL